MADQSISRNLHALYYVFLCLPSERKTSLILHISLKTFLTFTASEATQQNFGHEEIPGNFHDKKFGDPRQVNQKRHKSSVP